MATSATTLVNRVRRFVRDNPDYDALTASVSSGGTTLTVADASTTVYSPRWAIEVDQEAMLVRSGSGTSLTVKRGASGTTAASHASGAAVLIRPQFLSQDILEALNSAIQNSFPLIYRPVLDTSLTTAANTFEYTVPNMPGTYNGASIPMPRLSKVELKESGDYDYREVLDWDVLRGTTPKVQFRFEKNASATIRVTGFGPFPDLAFSDSLDALWPVNAEDYLVYYAASYLTASGEAGRVRTDTGAIDNREQANRVGSSMSASNYLFQRAQKRLVDAALPPMPKHVKAVL
jgi:hypothetical protein